MTDGVYGCVTDDISVVEDGCGCGDDDGNASQEQQRARGLVHCGAEHLNIVFEAANQEATPCKACISKSPCCVRKCRSGLCGCKIRKPMCELCSKILQCLAGEDAA